MKALVTYFSAESGKTRKVAEEFSKNIEADLFEIVPDPVYSPADLKWMNPMARCNREKFGKKDVPVTGAVENFADYDTIYIGFPIWYGCAPLVGNTFCKGYDWTGKRVAVFATSGGSGIGKTAEKLQPFVSGAELLGAKLVHGGDELADWARGIL